MSNRKTELANGEFYHVYNRGVDKREVFSDDSDFQRFLIILREFNCQDAIGSLYEKSLREKKHGSSTPFGGIELPVPELVEIIAYCLNPNHYHLILKQNSGKRIQKFMQKIGTGYTNYFNKKYKRSGALFQGRFKSIHVDSNEYLLYLSAYVNRNNFIHGYGNNESEWKYCSVLDYLGKRNGTLCNKDIILDQFKTNGSSTPTGYEEFLNGNALHLKNKKEIERYLLED
jgi:putative transposase